MSFVYAVYEEAIHANDVFVLIGEQRVFKQFGELIIYHLLWVGNVVRGQVTIFFLKAITKIRKNKVKYTQYI